MKSNTNDDGKQHRVQGNIYFVQFYIDRKLNKTFQAEVRKKKF